MSTGLLDAPVTDTTDTDDPSHYKHIVHDKGKVTEAYINGTSVEALCGHVFVPSRDPSNLPLCSRCKEIRERAGGNMDNLK